MFLGKCIERETLCIYQRTKSVGYRQEREKGYRKSVNMVLDTLDIISLLLVSYENILSKMPGT